MFFKISDFRDFNIWREHPQQLAGSEECGTTDEWGVESECRFVSGRIDLTTLRELAETAGLLLGET